MKKNHRWELVHYIVFLLLIPTIGGLLLWISYLFPMHWDWTPSGQHSLSETGRALAEELPDDIELVAFVRREKDRRSVQRFVSRYQQHRPELKLTFIDPWAHPDKVNQYRPETLGDIIISYNGRYLKLSPAPAQDGVTDQLSYREKDFNRIVSRLLRDKDFTLYFLSGHGERLPMTQGNRDFSLWGGLLQQNGYILESLPPAQLDQLQDIRLLVIASPQIPLTPDETRKILKFVRQGGHLLWLTDPGPLRGLDDLASALGLALSEQAIVTTQPTAGIPNQAMLLPDPLQYGDHPILDHFALQTLFINSRALHRRDPLPEGQDLSWRYIPLIQSNENTTMRDETGNGPFTLAVALERSLDQDRGSQRVVLLGDGDFLSNTYLQNGGNAELGLRVVDWLADNESNLAIPPSFAPDVTLNISPTARAVQLAFFVGVLPAGLIIIGVLLRRYRSRL